MSSLYCEPKITFLASRHVRNFENAAGDGSAHCACYLSAQDIGKTSLAHAGLVLISNQVSTAGLTGWGLTGWGLSVGRGQLKCDGTCAETRFGLSAQRTSPFKSAGGRQFSRLPAAEVCAYAVIMLDTPCSEVV